MKKSKKGQRGQRKRKIERKEKKVKCLSGGGEQRKDWFVKVGGVQGRLDYDLKDKNIQKKGKR